MGSPRLIPSPAPPGGVVLPPQATPSPPPPVAVQTAPMPKKVLRRWTEMRKGDQHAALAGVMSMHEEKIKEQKDRLQAAIARKRQLATQQPDFSPDADDQEASAARRLKADSNDISAAGMDTGDTGNGVIVLESQAGAEAHGGGVPNNDGSESVLAASPAPSLGDVEDTVLVWTQTRVHLPPR